MSNNPITKVARRGFDARMASDVNLSFSSEWKTPKIFAQIGLRRRRRFNDSVSPEDANGYYDENGTYNGKPSYTNGSYWIWWNGSDTWNLTAAKGSGIVVFYRPEIEPMGYYYEGSGIGGAEVYYDGEWRNMASLFYLTSKTWENKLGYIPSFFAFRQLSSESPDIVSGVYGSAGLNSSCYTYSLTALQGDFDLGVWGRGYDNNLRLQIWNGWDSSTGKSWYDEAVFGLLYLNPLNDGIPPESYKLEKGGVFLLGSGDIDVRTVFPYYNSVDSRFDTLKIFKTGEVNLIMPSETVSGSKKVYTEIVPHNLGYPPVYLPEAGVGWSLDYFNPGYGSFILNDYLGFKQGYGDVIVDVYVDSENLYLRYTRNPSDFAYPSATVTMYYTIFYNEIGEEFNFLNDDYK